MDDYRRLERVFADLADLPASAREAVLRQRCADDPDLLERALALLAHYHDQDEWTVLDAAVQQEGSVAPAPIPLRIGPYTILEELGRGGMGRVYAAEREGLGKRVALKVISSPFAGLEAQRRFDAEQRILARLEHPGIAALLDAGVASDGVSWFAMERVDGLPITHWVREHDAPLERRIGLVLELCDALAYAHANLVVHRDIKPGNVLVTTEGRTKLLDFGVATLLRVAETDPDGSHTQVFTPAYASPEQVRGDRPTVATDVYQVGALLYELLCGVTPFDVETLSPVDAARLITDEEPRAPSENPRTGSDPHGPRTLRRHLRGDLDRIVLKCLEKSPARRYPSVGALAEDLHRYLDGRPVLARPGGWAYRSAKFVRRHRPLVAGITLGLAWLCTSQVQNIRIAAERDRAETAATVAERERDRARIVTDFLVGLFEAGDPGSDAGPDMTALDLLRRGAARVDTLGSDVGTQATVLLAIASSINNLSLPSEAEPLLRRLLALADEPGVELPEPVHRDELRFALAENVTLQNRLAEGESIYRSLVDGPRASPAIGVRLRAYEGLMRALHMQGRPIAADSAQQRWEALLGTATDLTDRETVRQMALLGRNYVYRAEIRADPADQHHAWSLLTRSVDAYRTLVPPSSLDFRLALMDLTRLTIDMGDFVAADTLSAEGVQLMTDDYAVEGDLWSFPLSQRASVLEQAGDVEGAERLMRRAVRRERDVGAESPAWASRALDLGAFLRRHQRFDEAAAVFEATLPFHRQEYGPDHVMTAIAERELGSTLAAAGLYERAEALLLAGYAQLRAERGDEDGVTQLHLRALGDLYRRWGRPQEEARYVARMTEPVRARYQAAEGAPDRR